jgi:hypothetical protein
MSALEPLGCRSADKAFTRRANQRVSGSRQSQTSTKTRDYPLKMASVTGAIAHLGTAKILRSPASSTALCRGRRKTTRAGLRSS